MFDASSIVPDDLNEGAKYATYSTGSASSYKEVGQISKPAGTSWILSTGALKKAKILNIYEFTGVLLQFVFSADSDYCFLTCFVSFFLLSFCSLELHLWKFLKLILQFVVPL